MEHMDSNNMPQPGAETPTSGMSTSGMSTSEMSQSGIPGATGASLGGASSAGVPSAGVPSAGVPTAGAWLPEDLRGTGLERYKSVSEMGKAFISARNLLAKKAEDFSVNDKQAFLQMREEAFDIPQSPDGYEIDTRPLPYTEEVLDEAGNKTGEVIDKELPNALNDEEMKFLKEACYDLGLPREKGQQLYDKINRFANNSIATQQQQAEQRAGVIADGLGKMWGEANIDNALADIATGVSVAAKAIGCDEQELKDELAGPMLQMSCPHLVELFRNLAQLGGRGYAHRTSIGNTNADRQNEIELLRNDPQFKREVWAIGKGKRGGEAWARIKELTRYNNDGGI